MSYGIEVTMENGKTFNTNVFSSNTYDLIQYTTGSGTYVKSYPELVGYKIYAMTQRMTNLALDACASVVVSYPDGVPTLTCTTLVGPGANGLPQGGYPVTNIYVVVS